MNGFKVVSCRAYSVRGQEGVGFFRLLYGTEMLRAPCFRCLPGRFYYKGLPDSPTTAYVLPPPGSAFLRLV